MRINQRRWPCTVAGTALLAALALAAPSAMLSQDSTARADSPASAVGKSSEDRWYPEGFLRIRGKRYSLFVGATFTQFTNADSRTRFGAGTVSPTFELYRPQHGGFSPVLEFNDTRIESSDSLARVVAVSAGVRYRLVDAEPSRWLVPFVSIGAGPRWARVSGTERTAVFGAGIQVGVEVLRSVRLTTRYDALPGVFGHQLSAMAFGVAFRLPPYRRGNKQSASCADAECAR